MVACSGQSPAPAGSRPRVLVVLEHMGPSAVLTVLKPLSMLHRTGQILVKVTLSSLCSARQIRRADVVVFSRSVDLSVLAAVLAAGKPMIYDIDDNPFARPLYLAWAPHVQNLFAYECYLQAASLVRVYSEPMHERTQQLNSHVVRVDGPVDWQLVPALPPRRHPARVRIVYATGRYNHDPFAALFMDDLRQLLHVYHNRVEMFFWGYHPPEFRKASAVHFLRFTPNYDRFFSRFARAGFDIGLAPLYNDLFCRSKTNNKFREYAACRVAGVYSNVDVYASCVEDGRTGLLVSSAPGTWFTALAQLIDDATLRQQIQQQAFRYVRTRYSVEAMQATWLTHIHEVIGRARGPRVQWDEGGGAGEAMVPPQSAGRLRPQPLRTARLSGTRLWRRILRRWTQAARSLNTQGLGPVVRQIVRYMYKYYAVLRLRWTLSPLICALRRNNGWPQR